MSLIEKGAPPHPALRLDMSPKEAKSYSYARAILNAVLRQEGAGAPRSFEDEIAETIRKSLPQNYRFKGGVLVPMQLRAGLDSGAANAGTELKYSEFGGEIIELLRAHTAVIGMGARVLPGLTSPISFPKQTGSGTAYWIDENSGNDVPESELTTSTVTLAPKSLMGFTKYSRQLLQQSAGSVESLVRADLAAMQSLAIDKAALHGSGTANNPTGIYRTSGVEGKAMGGVPTYDIIQDMITDVATSNALLGSLGWLTTPGMAGKLAKTPVIDAAGSDMIWKGKYEDGVLNGYKAVATNQVSSLMNVLVDSGGSSHGMIFGNWSDLLIGMWGALELIIDPYKLVRQGMVEVTSFQMADIEVRHVESFTVATGAAIT